MGVHEQDDSKYKFADNNSSDVFYKISGKRASDDHFVSSSKHIKIESADNNNSEVTNAEQQHKEQGPAGAVEKKTITLQQQRKDLPVVKLRKQLLEQIRKNDTSIIVGDTGCGKTTQIPQLLYESGMAGSCSCIGITQPKKVAAINIARRVALEQNTAVGKLVGWSVRFEDMTSPETRIKYLTDSALIREAIIDNQLLKYSIIILDEVHERSIQTDVLVGLIKRAQKLRRNSNASPLKIIVMSATMDVDKFAKYFETLPIYVEGRQYPTKVYHAKESQNDYQFSALATAFQIHQKSPANEDILIFLTDQEEIEVNCITARQAAKLLDGKGYPALKVFPLYSSLPTHQQLDAFKPSPPGMRKLILSTDIAETSLTIGGIRTVIDTGVVKQCWYDPILGHDVLRYDTISKAQALQRLGRCGREGPGVCFRTYTKAEFEKIPEMPVPEIQRYSLINVALWLLAIKIDITTFDFMDKPSEETIANAIAYLERLGAVSGTPACLTSLGETMALFPLDPRFTKVILASVEYECLEEALTVIALLSAENIFVDSPTKHEEALTARSRFKSEEGDHVTLLNVYNAYTKKNQKKVYCQDNFLNHRNLEYAVLVRKQLLALSERAGLVMTRSSVINTENLRRALLDGLSENLAELQEDRTYVVVKSRHPVAIHPSSILSGTRPRLVLFTEVVRLDQFYIKGLSIIDPAWLNETIEKD
ncbi:hypothetical protein TKK_0019385 [Trichogramma kaykai]|uniref:RNA helicase n=1 Tax=Trichogramma kaykai TaxID=54128 RepID=A0ABD2VUA4_9HYME